MSQKLAFIKLIVLFTTFSLCAQVSFVKGYYVDNNGEKKEGYIKNLDWQKTPIDFIFKTSAESEKSIIKLSEAREVGSENLFRFVRAYVDVDISSANLNEMSTQKEPVYNRIEAFVKTLVKGPISLYEYNSGDFNKYYYQRSGDKRLIPLVSKKYLDNNQNINNNNTFRNQLYQLYNLELNDNSKIKYLSYDKKSLSKFVEKNNNLKGLGGSYVYKRAKTKDWFKLHLRPGISFSNIDIQEVSNSSIRRDFELDTELNLRVGVLGEFILPFNNNKWSIIVETAYQSYSQESETKNISPSSAIERLASASADISSLEISAGLRHYFYFSKNSGIYINAGGMYDFWFNQNLEITSNNSGFSFEYENFRNNLNAFAGLGYIWDKFAIEFNLQTNQQLTPNEGEFDTKFSTYSIILSYKVF